MLAVLVAQFAIAGGSSDDSEIAALQRQVAELRADAADSEAEAARKKKRKKPKVRVGPQGPAGPAGPGGAAGSPSASMLFGWIGIPDLPTTSGDYTPLGDGGATIGTMNASPNAPVVLRDLFVRVNAPPGVGARWVFALQGPSSAPDVTCEIIGSFDTTCDSGAQTESVPAGSSLRLIVSRVGAAVDTQIYYAYRAVTP